MSHSYELKYTINGKESGNSFDEENDEEAKKHVRKHMDYIKKIYPNANIRHAELYRYIPCCTG
jgi:hypothetical protein